MIRRTKGFAAALPFVVVGAILAYPLTARSKGQWCNDTEEGRRVDLTLESSAVDGVPMPAPAGSGLHLKTEFYGETNEVHAEVAESDGGTRVLHVTRTP